MKTIFLEIKIRDGEREYSYRVLFTTKCKNLDFAVQYYIAHFWGKSYLEDGVWWAWNGEISMSCKHYKEVNAHDLKVLNKYFI